MGIRLSVGGLVKSLWPSLFFFKILFIFRERGRVGEKGRETST